MASFSLEGSRFLFKDERGERVLLDCTDYLANKSRVSMRRLPQEDFPTIREILADLIQKQQTKNGDLAIAFGMIDVLLVKRMIRSAKPVRLLEYGGGRGDLSVHLARLLGTFHKESALVCLCDTIEPEWMERISQVKEPPALSYLACDFGASGLEKNSFDVVILNGLADFPRLYDVLRDAASLVKPDGALFCYSDGTPLLESMFKLFFENREEYEFSPFCKIMTAEASACSWREAGVSDPAAEAQKHLAEAAGIPADGTHGHEACVQMLELLKRDIPAVARQGDAALKIQLLAEKERLLNCLIRCGGIEAVGLVDA